MRVVVVGLKGAPVAQSLAAQFGPAGGTIGRAVGSTLVLDDPERTVSRVHAQVLCRGGEFFIVDRGSNPLICNGQPLGAGNEVRLNNGDRLMIGGFELQVQDIPASAPAASMGVAPAMPGGGASLPAGDDPFAGLLDGLVPASPSAAPKATPVAPTGGAVLPPAAQNPMEFNLRAGAVPDPFADLLGPQSGGGAAPTAAIPEDFSDLGIPAGGAPSSIDALFGLGSTPSGADPFAHSPLADPLMQPNTATSADPLMALKSVAQPTAAARSDHVSALQQAFVAAPPSPTPAPKAPVLPADDFSDLLAPVAAPAPVHAPVHTAAHTSGHAPAMSRVEIGPLEIGGGASAPMPPTAPPPMSPPAPMPAAPVMASTPGAGHYSDTELLAAFLKGVDSTHQMPVALTPGLMERIGSMLRSATEGTLQLLLTRQEFKREVRAEVTMIGSQHNNPLKFSPTVEVALAHLLGPGVRGFMPAQEAMRDAFNDLRAHQFGVMVGLHAALDHVLQRFTPDELEKRLTEKTTLDALFAANRKAKLWDQFCTLHASITQEAQDDFHKLFGEAFSKAYEEQMARFKAEAGKG